MTDRLYFPEGSEFSVITGYGYYHESHEQIADSWQLKTTCIKRIRVEAV